MGYPIVFVVLLCCRLPPKLGEMAKVYRIVNHLPQPFIFRDFNGTHPL